MRDEHGWWRVGAGALHYGQPFFSVVRVPAGTTPAIVPQHTVEVNWGAPETTIQLWGYDLDQPVYRSGEQIGLTVYWRSAGESVVDYTVFVHLLGPDNPATGGPLWAQDDSEPCRRGYPTSAWATHETVVDPHVLKLPDNAPGGEYQIAIGLYEWQTMLRLPVLDALGEVAGDHVVLGALRVTASP